MSLQNYIGLWFEISLPLMCKNDESKTVRAFLAKVGDKWSILLVVMLAKCPNHRTG